MRIYGMLDEKLRLALDLNLAATNQHLLGVDIFSFTPRIGLGISPQAQLWSF